MNRPCWQQMADEHAQLEILELQDRVRDVEGERDAYRQSLQAALDAIRHVIRERDELRRLIDHWIFEERARRRKSLSSKAA